MAYKKNYPYGNHMLITGASSGLGLAAAEYFAKKGFEIWGVSRRCEEKTTARGLGHIHWIQMDVTQEESVRKAIQTILEQAGEIGTVLHCAGFGVGGAAEDVPADQALIQLDTNYLGVLRVNRALLPAMRKQGRGLVLVVSSVAGLISIPFQSHYSSSKYALEAYVEALRLECRAMGIKAALIEPGDTKTGFTGARKVFSPEDSPYRAQCLRSIKKMEEDELNGKPAISVAKTADRLMRKKNPPVRRAVGWQYRFLVGIKRVLPSRLIEWILALLYLPPEKREPAGPQ